MALPSTRPAARPHVLVRKVTIGSDSYCDAIWERLQRHEDDAAICRQIAYRCAERGGSCDVGYLAMVLVLPRRVVVDLTQELDRAGLVVVGDGHVSLVGRA